MNMINRNSIIIVTIGLILSIFGLATLYDFGLTNTLFYKQLIIIIVSIVLGISISFLDFRFLKQSNVLFYFYMLCILLLILLLGVGYTSNAAQSWFRLGSVSFQPSEIAKLAIIGLLAKYFYKRHIDIAYFSHIAISFLYTLVIGALVLKQPDLGSALVIFGIWAIVILISGVSKRHILFLVLAAGFISLFSWKFIFADYQKNRILNFIDPIRDVKGSGYNVYQSIIAVGSGGAYGKGLGFGTQSTLSYLPENETDFIFASFAEEWGFAGSVICILLFISLISLLFYLSLFAYSNFETLFISGVAAYFLIHFVVNVGMNLGLLPVTGIPLPFMSAGGSHILIEWIMLGLCISMLKDERKNKNYKIENELVSYLT